MTENTSQSVRWSPWCHLCVQDPDPGRRPPKSSNYKCNYDLSTINPETETKNLILHHLLSSEEIQNVKINQLLCDAGFLLVTEFFYVVLLL